ncbi:MAG: cadherin-like domain-containing protein [Winogradskyella sp.]|nr:cadherin-like domain-containing protein [Winogradskyella sp.]NNK40691.1 cadherin-like domain-containing protein [Winogradskyella sp.]NNL82587.1 cadherin-like domain-containing protein [Winogradskyella sp.]
MFVSLFSCGREEVLMPLIVETNPDAVITAQNTSVLVDIFANDSNVPENGVLTITTPTNGISEIDNNNTNALIRDDKVIFTPNANFTGTDSFEYTICDSSGNCSTAEIIVSVTSLSVVNNVTESFPYNLLSEYNLFEGDLKDLNPTYSVVPYELISPLFSDYAKKKRFVWMPNNKKASYVADHKSLEFPVGTLLIKNFYYNNVLPNNQQQLLETRLMFKTAEGWDFANYIWNETQTEAIYNEQGSNVPLSWIQDGIEQSVNYRIPSRAECFTCHNNFGTALPIGPKPQNLNKEYPYEEGIKNQLQKLIELGYLNTNIPNNITSVVQWDDPTHPINLRVRSYIDINCAHCHSDESYCEYRSMRFAFNENALDENMGICEDPETAFIPNSKIVAPGDKDSSILYYRINTTEQSLRMPLFGRTLQHVEGIRLIDEWINSLENSCD